MHTLEPENRDRLTAILACHVVAGALARAEVVGLSDAATLEGGRVSFRTDSGDAMVGGAKAVQADLRASHGVIHVIDGVLLPE